MTGVPRPIVIFFALYIGTALSNRSCERLKASLTYTQEKAPRDLSGLLPVVVEKVNRVLDGVVDVEVEWTGADLHGNVGEHFVECKVTRLASAVSSSQLETSLDADGREVTTQCFHVPFTILDTNECSLSKSHPMRHKCQSPSLCVNTKGSYECLCPSLDKKDEKELLMQNSASDETLWSYIDESVATRSPWELSFNSTAGSSCPFRASTHGCCPTKSHSPEGKECREKFRCPVDPCGGKQNDCDPTADCVRAESPRDFPNHKCACPDGLMGNGQVCRSGIDATPDPKVTFDGLPTELTVKNNFYCGCTKPTIDACSGFPPCKGKHEVCSASAGKAPSCVCKPGYVMHEEYGCVDVNPPILKLRNDAAGDKTLRLKQGDEYREYMVDIIDDNAEDYLRSLKISFSEPLPPGCLTQVGEFHVNYTVAMPWATHPFVRVTRRVVIDDIDECTLDVAKYKKSCPSLVPQCDTQVGATCKNTIGSYLCVCPTHSSGDGFLKESVFPTSITPEGYKGGTSCVDTSKPIITLLGPNPKSFQTCECGGLSGVMSESPSGRDGSDQELQASQRMLYEGDLKEMIRSSAGAELCASHGLNRPTPKDCVKAVDHTHKGEVDVSEKVVVGDPVKKSPLHWVVPYDVKDDAGNQAATVWRDVIVQEIDLMEIESRIREEVFQEHRAETKKIVEKAVEEAKIKWEREQGKKGTGGSSRKQVEKCYPCPKCEVCSSNSKLSKAACEPYCGGSGGTCSPSDQHATTAIIVWLEELFPSWMVPFLMFTPVISVAFLVLRFIAARLFFPRSNYPSYDYGVNGDHRTGDNDLFFSPLQPTTTLHGSPPPRQSLLQQRNDAFFAPPPATPAASENRDSVQYTGVRHSGGNDDEGVYATSPPIITPSRTGDGVRRQSPFRQGF